MASERWVGALLGRATGLSRLRALLDDALSGRPRVVSGDLPVPSAVAASSRHDSCHGQAPAVVPA